MADTLDRIDIKEGQGPASDAPTKKPKLRLSFLRQAWQDWSNGLPCVQEFYAKQAAEAGKLENSRGAATGCRRGRP